MVSIIDYVCVYWGLLACVSIPLLCVYCVPSVSVYIFLKMFPPCMCVSVRVGVLLPHRGFLCGYVCACMCGIPAVEGVCVCVRVSMWLSQMLFCMRVCVCL